jgi:hypothetical protein
VDGAAVRKKSEAILHLLNYASVFAHHEAAETTGEVIFFVELCNEVENRQLLLAGLQTETTA